jgi:hypothetical protein
MDVLLVLTSSEDHTADYLCHKLRTAGVRFVRLDSEEIAIAWSIHFTTSDPVLLRDGVPLPASRIRNVWYRRPKPLAVSFEGDANKEQHAASEWSEGLEGYLAHIDEDRWMNHPARNANASHKIEQLTRAGRAGLRVPETLVTQCPAELERFWEQCGGEVITKPLSSGVIDRPEPAPQGHIYTSVVTEEYFRLRDRVQSCPSFFQRRIRKAYDVRVTAVDNEFHCVGLCKENINEDRRIDIRRDNMKDVCYSEMALPSAICNALRNLLRSYHLRFGAFDFAVTPEGEWFFFELNPNGQWAWLDLVGVTDIAASFVRAFQR